MLLRNMAHSKTDRTKEVYRELLQELSDQSDERSDDDFNETEGIGRLHN